MTITYLINPFIICDSNMNYFIITSEILINIEHTHTHTHTHTYTHTHTHTHTHIYLPVYADTPESRVNLALIRYHGATNCVNTCLH